MKIVFASIYSFLASLLFCTAQQPCCLSEIPNLHTATIEELGKEMHRLKSLKQNCCYYFTGDLRVVMEEAGKRIEASKMNRISVQKALGQPDNIYNVGALRPYVDFQEAIPSTAKVWVYHWRGNHDFLYLVFTKKTLIAVGWYYAYE